MAYEWGARLLRGQRAPVGPVHIYEVELEDVEADVNGRRNDPDSVMARSGRVLRKIGSFSSQAELEDYARSTNAGG